MKTSNVVITFDSVSKMLWRDHSSETPSAVLSQGTILSSIFCKMKCGIFLDFGIWTLLGVKGLTNQSEWLFKFKM